MSYLPPSDDVTYHRQYIQVSASFITFIPSPYLVRGKVTFSVVCVCVCVCVCACVCLRERACVCVCVCVCDTGGRGPYPIPEIYSMMQFDMARAPTPKRDQPRRRPQLWSVRTRRQQHTFIYIFVDMKERKKRVAWSPMIPFALGDKNIMTLSSSAKGPVARKWSDETEERKAFLL